ncbi:hypothetical protein ACFLV3_07205 [Chloroflexota bacterium]
MMVKVHFEPLTSGMMARLNPEDRINNTESSQESRRHSSIVSQLEKEIGLSLPLVQINKLTDSVHKEARPYPFQS